MKCRMMAWGYHTDPRCVLCNGEDLETRDHLFDCCSYARLPWDCILFIILGRIDLIGFLFMKRAHL